eukprot:252046-Pelagomonas_calceolata.AAC.1
MGEVKEHVFGETVGRMRNQVPVYRFKEGDLQQDCSADQPVAGPCQPTANPKAQTQKRKACCCVARGCQIQLGR